MHHKKPPYRTVFVVLALAAMGGAVAFAHLDNDTYKAFLDLLKVLGGAQSLKAIGEHVATAFVKPQPVTPP